MAVELNFKFGIRPVKNVSVQSLLLTIVVLWVFFLFTMSPMTNHSEVSFLLFIHLNSEKKKSKKILKKSQTHSIQCLDIRNWVRNIEQHASESVNKMLIGNKCDLVDKRVVETERGQALADEYNIKFMETSAKNSINVDKAFISLAKDIKNRLIDNPDADGKGKGTVDVNAQQEQAGGCGC